MRHCGQCGAALAAELKFCTSCGAPVAPSGTETLPTPVAPSSSAPPVDRLDNDARTAPPRARRQRSLPLGRLAAFAAVGLALVAGAFIAWRVLSDQGGAATAEEAATGLVEAIAAQDGVAALRMMAPGEIEGVDDVYSTVQERLAEDGLTSSDDGALSDALDISLKGLEVDVDEMDENAARVYLSGGELEVRLDVDKLDERLAPIAARFPDGKTWTVSAKDVFDNVLIGEEERPFLTAVRIDGRWYVSAVATAGEYAIEEYGLDAADYGAMDEEGPTPVAAEEPEVAVNTVIDALGSNDPEELLAVLPSEEFVTLRPFMQTIRSWQEYYGAELLLERDGNLDTEFEEDGDLGRLTVRNANFSATAYASGEGGSGSVAISGDCLETSGDRACMTSTFTDLTGLDSFWVMLSESDDGWQVDPVATAVSYARTVVEVVPESVALQAVGLESLIQPSAEATPNEVTTVTTDGVGTALLTVEADRGQVIVLSPNEDSYGEIYAPGAITYARGYDSLLASEAGTYRIVLTTDEMREQTLETRVDVLAPKVVESAEELKPFPGQESGAYTVSLDGTYTFPEEANFEVYDADGGELYLYGSDTLDGTYTIVVREPVSISKVTTGFEDGGANYEGTANEGETLTLSMNLVEGLTTSISCSSAEDLSLSLPDLDVYADDGLSGSETLVAEPYYTGSYALEIFNYGTTASFSCTID